MKKYIYWWCPKCKSAVTVRGDCPKCKTERVSSWRCDKCQRIVVDSTTCPGCGISSAKNRYNRRLVAELFEETGPSGHTNEEILRRYAYARAYNKNIPEHLVEDAISSTFVKLVKNFKDFDPDKASFRTWATSILKNELANIVRDDVKENNKVGLRLDWIGDDDSEVQMEKVLGYTFGVDDLIRAEEKRRYQIMAALARKALGDYTAVVKGEVARLSIYDLGVRIYSMRDGYGWLTRTANEAGIKKQTLGQRVKRAKDIWESWHQKDQ